MLNNVLSHAVGGRLGLDPTSCSYLAQTTEWGQACGKAYFVRLLLMRTMSCFHLWCYWRWDTTSQRTLALQAKDRASALEAKKGATPESAMHSATPFRNCAVISTASSCARSRATKG